MAKYCRTGQSMLVLEDGDYIRVEKDATVELKHPPVGDGWEAVKEVSTKPKKEASNKEEPKESKQTKEVKNEKETDK